MTTITQAITPLPTAPDPATDTPDEFSTNAAAFVLAQKSMAVELEAFRGQANTVAGEVNANAVIAADAVDQLQAASFAFRYLFATSTTMGDPGAGTVRLNHATISSATAIAFDATSNDSGNPDVSDFIATWGASTNTIKGQIIIRKVGAPATFATFNITAAVTDNTGWLQVAVAYVAGNGTFSASDELMFQYVRAGDEGAAGFDSMAFSAYRNGDQTSIANNTYTKVQFNAEFYDLNSTFDSTTNYRHTPTVAGKYEYIATILWSGVTPSGAFSLQLQRNTGATNADLRTSVINPTGTSINQSVTVSGSFDMNGTTDYVEVNARQITGGTATISGIEYATFITGKRIA